MSAQYDEPARGCDARMNGALRIRAEGRENACRLTGGRARNRASTWSGVTAAAALAALLGACSAGAPTRPADEAGVAPQTGSDNARADRYDDSPLPAEAVDGYSAAVEAMQREDAVEAEMRFEQLMREYPELPGPYVNTAILYRQDGRHEDARGLLERALAIDPAHSEANNELGILLREAGEFAAAEEAYRRALEGDPAYSPALYNLGVLLDLYLHRREEALAYYEAYQQSLSEPDETVALWIIDLRRRVGPGNERVAQRSAP